MRIMGAIEDAVRVAGRRLFRCALREAVWIFVVAALVAAGTVFGLIAVYNALLLVWPAWGAAAACAGGAFALALLAVVIRTTGRARPSAPSVDAREAVNAIGDDISHLTEAAKHEALEQYRKDPVGTLVGAVAVGAIIGFLKPRD